MHLQKFDYLEIFERRVVSQHCTWMSTVILGRLSCMVDPSNTHGRYAVGGCSCCNSYFVGCG